MTLTEFLLARIADNMQDVEAHLRMGGRFPYPAEQMEAECEAKRRIVEMLSVRDDEDHPAVTAHATGLRLAVKALAAVYADHPDYREEWRP